MIFHPLQNVALATACGAFLAGGLLLSAQQDNAAQPKKPAADEKTIRNLIKRLGDNSFEVREKADEQLQAIGEVALELLRQAAKADPDLEIRNRADKIVRAITTGMFREVRRFEGHNDFQRPWLNRVVVTPDGKQAITVGADGLRVWDLEDGKQMLAIAQPKSSDYCWALAISKMGDRVIAGANDGIARVYEVNTGKKVQELVGHSEMIWGVALLAWGKQAVTGAWDRSLRVWDVETGKELRRLEGVNHNVRCLAVSPDEKTLAAGLVDSEDVNAANTAGVVRLWDLENAKEIRAMKGHTREISSATFAPDGKTVLSSSFDATVRLWDVASGKELKRFVGHGARVECAAFTPNGRFIMSCGNDGRVRVWDIESATQLYESPPVRSVLTALAVLPDGLQCITVGQDTSVRLWRLAHLP
jgi:WD40 repeat protein